MPILRIQKVVVTAARFLISTKLHCVVQTSFNYCLISINLFTLCILNININCYYSE